MSLNKPNIAPPKAEKKPITIEQLGRTRIDNYAWLKDANWQDVMKDPSQLDPEIEAYLRAENDYSQAVMEDTKDLQTQIFEEMKGRIKDDDSTVPAPDGEYLYAERYRPGDQHGLYVRTRKDSADEEILLDADALAAASKAAGEKFFNIASVAHSDDHKLLAYAVDTKGSERFVIHVIDLSSGETTISTVSYTHLTLPTKA